MYEGARTRIGAARASIANASEYEILSGIGEVGFDVVATVAPGGALTRAGRLGELTSVGNRGVTMALRERAFVEAAGTGRVVAAETTLAGDLAPGFYRANPAELRFSQSTASPNFGKGGTINDLVTDLNNGLRPEQVGGGPLQVVIRDGVPFPMDNRRLVAFNAAGVRDIPIEAVSLKNPNVAARFAGRFDPIAGQGKMIVVVDNAGKSAAQQLLYDNRLIRRAP